jgi:hypothetical protein
VGKSGDKKSEDLSPVSSLRIRAVKATPPMYRRQNLGSKKPKWRSTIAGVKWSEIILIRSTRGLSSQQDSKSVDQTLGSEEQEKGGLISTASKLLALYAVYVFISGWSFLDYYYRYYGVDTRWLDLTTYDILIKGFTVLFTGGWPLWPLYILLIALPLIAERKVPNRIWSVLAITVVLLLILLGVYLVSRAAGERMAQIDKSDKTTLPSVIFRSKITRLQYHGKLLGFRSGTYFIHGLALVPGQQSAPLDVSETPLALELSMLRSEDISDVTIGEHQ